MINNTSRTRQRPCTRLALHFASLASAAALLVGCSGEPSEKDIRGAMEQQASQATQAARGLSGGMTDSLKVTYHKVTKLGCEVTGQDNAFLCDVQFDVTAPVVGRRSGSGRIRLVEGDDGWIAMEQ